MSAHDHDLRPVFLATQGDAYNLQAMVWRMGGDWLVAIWGGERPHIGAVAMAQARPSLRDPDRTSATVSVFCYPGHKEDEIVKRAAEQLAASLEANVVVTAGVHWDRIDGEGIERVLENGRTLVTMIQKEISRRGGKAWPRESS